MTRLDEGIVSLPNGGKGGDGKAGWLEFYGQYTDVDITVTARDYHKDKHADERTDVLFVFENGAHLSFGLTTFSDGTVAIQTFNKENTDDGYEIYPARTDWGQHLTGNNLALYQGEGIDFRIQRVGTEIYLYINGTKHTKVANLANNPNYLVTDNMKANVYLRHWGDDGVEVVIPYSISAAPDTELFYINEKKLSMADPFVLDNTAVDGYYYMYGTYGTCYCYRSTNLMDWVAMGNAIDKAVSEEVSNVLKADVWAPEVVYDSDTQTYYMFFSATPAEDTEAVGSEAGTAQYLLMVATSKSPYTGFELVDFTKLRDYDTTAYPQYYAKYALFNPTLHAEFCKKDKTYSTSRGGYIPAIDPHPYEDKTGKYLFWVDQDGDDRICAVKMTDWLTPDWDTATVIACSNYYTVADYKTAQSWPGALLTQKVSYETADNNCNEAPTVLYHNGKYYLTYSFDNYNNSTYQVGIAVAEPDSNGGPLGTYRKLTEKEGAILLSAALTESQEITGTGHHSFVTVGDNMYIVYHRHDDIATSTSARNPAIDEVKWIKNSDGLDVMYVNGPTCTLQPKIDAFSEYTNIAEEAAVSVSSDNVTGISYLTDGLLSVRKDQKSDVINSVGETTIAETTTFTFDLDSARDVRGIMVYNSKTRSTIFTNISKIELVYEENGVEETRTIEGVEFDSKYYADTYVTPGAAAYTEFAYMNVRSIKITIDVPVGQDSVGISEVRILGK